MLPSHYFVCQARSVSGVVERELPGTESLLSELQAFVPQMASSRQGKPSCFAKGEEGGSGGCLSTADWLWLWNRETRIPRGLDVPGISRFYL